MMAIQGWCGVSNVYLVHHYLFVPVLWLAVYTPVHPR